MLYIGEKVKYYGRDAIILNTSDDEVLLFIDAGYVKWVDSYILKMDQSA